MKEIRALPDCECDRDISCKVTISGSYYMKHKNTKKIHLILHYRHHYKKYFLKNTQDASWDFEKLCTVKFRACKVRISDPDTGKDEWEVLLTNLNRQIYAHMIMFNTVSQINAQAYVPQWHCKYTYIINFKMSCRIIHKQYNYSSTDTTFLKILRRISRYTVPVRPGRKDKRYIKVKAPVCFLYRVA